MRIKITEAAELVSELTHCISNVLDEMDVKFVFFSNVPAVESRM